MLIRIVLCIDQKKIRDSLKKSFTSLDAMVEVYENEKSAWQKVIRSCGDIIIISKSIIPPPIEMSISLLNDLPESPTTIIVHDDNSSEEQANLITAGADVVLFSGISSKSMVEAIHAIFDSRVQYNEKTSIIDRHDFRPKISDFVSTSKSMQMFMNDVYQFIPSNAPLLILGETGVGKEHMAKAIHNEGPRAGGPFITVNTAALPEQLLESELFGHTQGAFTGATRSRRGAFELAHNGTIFLDEIGEMPMHLQAKLLRAIQEYEIKPLGSEKSIWVDVRIMAASNRNLELEIRNKNFRQDLYYRLSVITLTIPPLKERKEDIPIIALNFLDRYAIKSGYVIEGITDEAMDALCDYDWPGNIRELFNVLERAILLSRGNQIKISDLPNIFLKNRQGQSIDDFSDVSIWKNKTLQEVLGETEERVEKLYLESLLKETEGRIDLTAKRAGLNTRSLYNKMKKLNINKRNFKKNK